MQRANKVSSGNHDGSGADINEDDESEEEEMEVYDELQKEEWMD